MRKIKLSSMYSFVYPDPEHLELVKEKFGDNCIIVVTDEPSGDPGMFIAYAQSAEWQLYKLHKPTEEFKKFDCCKTPCIICDWHGPVEVEFSPDTDMYFCPICINEP